MLRRRDPVGLIQRWVSSGTLEPGSVQRTRGPQLQSPWPAPTCFTSVGFMRGAVEGWCRSGEAPSAGGPSRRSWSRMLCPMAVEGQSEVGR